MRQAESLEEQIKKTTAILAESRENLENNPDSYSAQLLYMSTENHLADLLRKLDTEKAGSNR